MILFDESLISSTHIELLVSVAGVFITAMGLLVLPILRDIREGQRVADDKQQKRHEENIKRFATLETDVKWVKQKLKLNGSMEG